MFQTEPILWLQGLGIPGLTGLMWLVSELGRPHFYLLCLIVVTFGFDLRKGWLVGQVLLWTAGLTEYAKNFAALPRPLHVDSRVVYPPEGRPHQELFTARGATGLFDGLPRDVIDFYRAHAAVQTEVAWGLPSGHTSVFTGFCGSLAVVFQRRRWWLATAAAALVMGLSRMYLGRHFLADAAVAGLRLALQRPGGALDFLAASPSEVSRRVSGLSFGLFSFVAPAVLLPLAIQHGEIYVAQLWAWNLGFWHLSRRARDYSGGGLRQRAWRVLLGLAVGLGCALGLDLTFDVLGLDDLLWADLLEQFATILLLVVVTTRLAERLGLYGEAA
jgi:membrane-associated phospholipid phosphatase